MWQRAVLLKQQSKKKYRLSRSRTKEKARHAAHAAAEVVSREYCSLIFRPRPAFWYRKATESLAGPENDLRLLLSSLTLSQIHATCISSTYPGYISCKCKSNNQPNCCSFPLHPTDALLSFMPSTACSGSPHNATHSASISAALQKV